MGPVSGIALSLLGTLLGIVLTAFLREPIHSALARMAAGFVPRSSRTLAGFWQLEYDYAENGTRKREVQIVALRSVAGAVFGRTVASRSHAYTVKGHFRQEFYFTGFWQSIKPGHSYHGSFQLILQPDGVELNGKWLGFSERLETVNHGDWSWKRLSHTLRKKERDAALQRFRELTIEPSS
jgi:hypothetical protein